MAWISEIHYQNTYASSSGVSEYVEISLSPAEFARASDFEFAAYQGTGTSSLVVNLSSIVPAVDPDNGNYVFTIQVDTTDPDTGILGASDAEAVALIDNSLGSPVVEFYDIGGGTTAITATDGPASGSISTNIPSSSGGTSIQFTKTGTRIDGVLSQDSTVICFCEKTLIQTNEGQIPVEHLKPGDLVLNANGDFIPLRWIGGRSVRDVDLASNHKLRPIRIMAGALGNALPMRDLLVSRQHRILVKSKIAMRVAGVPEVLVAATKLTKLPGIFIDVDIPQVKYFHLLFDSHQVIFAEGAAAESLLTGPEALKGVSDAAKVEIRTLFPKLSENKSVFPARCIPNGKLQTEIISRHAKNLQPLHHL